MFSSIVIAIFEAAISFTSGMTLNHTKVFFKGFYAYEAI